MEGLAKRVRRRRRKGTLLSRSAIKFGAFCIALVLFTSAPIWGVQYFIVQDGSGHVHSAWMLLELLRGNPLIAEIHQFNLITFPNSGGHWLLAFFLLFTSAITATKLLMSITYVGFVASIGWLRWTTHGRDGLAISIVFGAAIGYNFLWLHGFYNFILGLIIVIFGVGLYFRWRERFDVKRAAVIALLIAAAFWCHIISFAIFSLALFAVAVIPWSQITRRRLALTAAAFIPVMPLVYLYRAGSEAGGPIVPAWRNLSDPLSPLAWITHLRGVDSFVLISRSAFPFVDVESPLFGVFAPMLFISAALVMLFIGAFRRIPSERKDRPASIDRPFLILSGGLIVFSLLSPDDVRFTSSAGTILRERLFLVGLAFTVPLLRFDGIGRVFSRSAFCLLAFVVILQTVVMWEYAVRSDRDAREFFAASSAIPSGASAAGITIRPQGSRFAATHIPSINNYNGIGRDVRLWDNYELGHYLFPVVMRSRDDQEFILKFTQSNNYTLDEPGLMDPARIEVLRSLLASEPRRIDTLVVWGSEPNVDAAIFSVFGATPIYHEGNVRIFRR